MKENLEGKKALHKESGHVIEIQAVEEHALVTWITSTGGIEYELTDLDIIKSVCTDDVCENKPYRPESELLEHHLFCCEKGFRQIEREFLDSYKR